MTAEPIDRKQLARLVYYLTIAQVAKFSGAYSEDEVLAWIHDMRTPTEEQVARLNVAHAQFDRVEHGAGLVTALAWFDDDISILIRKDLFKEVEASATDCMMPHD